MGLAVVLLLIAHSLSVSWLDISGTRCDVAASPLSGSHRRLERYPPHGEAGLSLRGRPLPVLGVWAGDHAPLLPEADCGGGLE